MPLTILLRFFTIIYVFTFAISPFPAQAIEVEVKVFEKGVNAVEARSKALKKAEERGFRAILKQKSPEYSEQLLKDYAGYNVGRYILGYHAKNEIVTDTSYRATIVLDFDDAFIGNVLNKPVHHQYPTHQTTTNHASPVSRNAILVIPILRGPQGITLWEQSNLWRQYINEAVLEQGQGQYVVPYGDQQDQLSLSAETVLSANYPRLFPLMERYGTNRALVLTIHERGLTGFGMTVREVGEQGDSFQTKQLLLEDGISPRALLQQAARDVIVNHIEENQKTLDPEQAKQMELHTVIAFLPLGNTRNWTDLRGRLSRIGAIEEMEVASAGARGITLNITFRGEPQKFGQALIREGIIAEKRDQQLWFRLR